SEQSRTKFLVVVLLSLALAAGIAACGGSDEGGSSDGGEASAATDGKILGAGSTAQELAQELWTEEFNAGSAPIAYEAVGSEEGRQRFLEGEVAFAGVDTPLQGDELSEAADRCRPGELIELPVYVSAVTIFANLRLTGMELSPQTLAKVLNGEITRWDDPTIKRENPTIGPIGLPPKLTITPVGLSDEPAITELITTYLADEAPDVWDYDASGQWPIEGGETTGDVTTVSEAVGQEDGTIGYSDFSHVGQLFGLVRIPVNGLFLEPNLLVTTRRLAGARVDTDLSSGPKTFPIELKPTVPAGAYPLVLVSYLIACTAYDSDRESSAVDAYVKYLMSRKAQEVAAEKVGSAYLPLALRREIVAAIY
ncbi:MAG TPA: substrate-binding domain-containing protein, partial [Gemmatimonadales bacterium]|nr:substrate-binding domain-containing protein [Gemmatimonadales bacterium]